MTNQQQGQDPGVRGAEGRVLFASGRGSSEAWDLQHQLSAHGYEVQTVGIEEARWLWPLEGYDLVLVDATERPMSAIDLCRHVKNSSSAQRVVLLFGDRTGAVPHQFHADAVVWGIPTGDQFLSVVHWLLAPGPSSASPRMPVQPAVQPAWPGKQGQRRAG